MFLVVLAVFAGISYAFFIYMHFKNKHDFGGDLGKRQRYE